MEKINKKKFLEISAAVIIGLGGGLETILSCAPIPRVSKEVVYDYQDKINSTLKDPHNYLRFLEEGEYILPNDVFEKYAQMVDKCNPFWSRLKGGHLHWNYLKGKEKIFQKEIKKLGYTNEQIRLFYTILSTSGNIIFKEEILKTPFFEKALPHERFHREMRSNLKEEELKTLYEAYEDLINQRYSLEEAKEKGINEIEIDIANRHDIEKSIPLVRDKIYPGKDDIGFSTMYAKQNWHEFYPYLAQREFEDRVEETLKKDYPQAYEIFNKIREKTKLSK